MKDLKVEYSLQLDIRPIVNRKNVALVGHAESIFGNNYGDQIDRADVVVRFHCFPVPEGKEYAMGSKTDLHYLGWLSQCIREKEIKNYQIDGVPVCGKKPELLHRIKNHWNPIEPETHAKFGAPGTWSATGIVATVDCLLSGAKSVSLFGFDFWESKDIFSGENIRHVRNISTPRIIKSNNNDKKRLRIFYDKNYPVYYDNILREIILRDENGFY